MTKCISAPAPLQVKYGLFKPMPQCCWGGVWPLEHDLNYTLQFLDAARDPRLVWLRLPHADVPHAATLTWLDRLLHNFLISLIARGTAFFATSSVAWLDPGARSPELAVQPIAFAAVPKRRAAGAWAEASLRWRRRLAPEAVFGLVAASAGLDTRDPAAVDGAAGPATETDRALCDGLGTADHLRDFAATANRIAAAVSKHCFAVAVANLSVRLHNPFPASVWARRDVYTVTLHGADDQSSAEWAFVAGAWPCGFRVSPFRKGCPDAPLSLLGFCVC